MFHHTKQPFPLCSCRTLILFTTLFLSNSCYHNTEIPPAIYGINYSPYIDQQDPNLGAEISEEQIRARMSIIKDSASWIRSFGATGGLQHTGRIAHELGLSIAAGAWLDANRQTNDNEIDNLILMAQAGEADLLIVGSEVLLRGDLTVADLIAYIKQVKSAVPNIQVTTAEPYHILLSAPELIAAVDIVLVNYYPYWEGISVDSAVAAIHNYHQKIINIANGKVVMVSETGWPSDGGQVGNAIPSPENAALFFLNFVSWAKANDVPYFYFEAFDEPWKAKYEGSQGAHWGIWDKEGNLKSGMQAILDGQTMADNWSQPGGVVSGGTGDPLIEFSQVPATTAAVLVANDYSPVILLGGSVLSPERYDAAAAYVEVAH